MFIKVMLEDGQNMEVSEQVNKGNWTCVMFLKTFHTLREFYS